MAFGGGVLQNYPIHFAGWSRAGVAPSQGVVISHPVGDVKKIAFDNQAPTWGNPFWSAVFDVGSYQAGGSGAALFDENHRIVGNTSLASASACPGSPSNDANGPRLDLVWPTLGPILDPLGTEALTLDRIANHDLALTGETFDGSTQDLAAGFFRTGFDIAADDVTVASTGALTLLARGAISITGDFTVESGASLRVDTFQPPGGAKRSAPPLPSVTEARAELDAQAFPNPSSGPVTIRFEVATPSHVRIVVYDALGREVERLMDAPHPAGSVRLTWDAASRLPSGAYVYRVTAGESEATGQFVVAR